MAVQQASCIFGPWRLRAPFLLLMVPFWKFSKEHVGQGPGQESPKAMHGVIDSIRLPEPYFADIPVSVRTSDGWVPSVKPIGLYLPHEWFAWLSLEEQAAGFQELETFWASHSMEDSKLDSRFNILLDSTFCWIRHLLHSAFCWIRSFAGFKLCWLCWTQYFAGFDILLDSTFCWIQVLLDLSFCWISFAGLKMIKNL